MQRLSNTTLEALLQSVLRRAKGIYADSLVSLVVFGSLARGDFSQGSDIDLLVVVRHASGSLGGRISHFFKAMRGYRESEEYKSAAKERLPRHLQPLILDVEELKRHPPLLLDMTTDAFILYDRDQVFETEMEILKKRMRELGSKRVWLDKKTWYWVLKPGLKIGEVVEI